MQQTASQQKDKFELHLEEMVEKLQACQQSVNVKSCSQCEKYLECELRDEYIKSVYNSMSKGDTGGFEF
jgi:hypothetical protein